MDVTNSLENFPVDAASDGQRRIVELLKRRSPMTPPQLAEALGQTPSAVRQHLDNLAKMRLIQIDPNTTKSQPTFRGRPPIYWVLTSLGNRLFPDRHDHVTVELIDSIRHSLGQGALDQVIEERTNRQQVAYQTALSRQRSAEAQVNELAQLRTDEGYIAEITKVSANEWRLTEHHCPICVAAQACQGFCSSELQVFQASLGDKFLVERTHHLLSGDERCVYTIRRRRPARSVLR